MASIYILGKELEGDFFDADFIDRYAEATKKMRDRAAAGEHAHYDTIGDAYRAQCRLAKDYFNEIFGEGTAEKLFGTSNNIKTHMQAIAEMTEAAKKCRKETNDFINKYTQRQKAATNQLRFQKQGKNH